MWVCDLCLEVNDDEHAKCIKCGEPKAPTLKLADEIKQIQDTATLGYKPVAAGYIPTTSLVIPNSTTVAPKLVRSGLIALAVGWAILVTVLVFSIVNPPAPAPAPSVSAGVGTVSTGLSPEFIRDRQILRIFLVIILPLFVLFIPSTHWEFNPKSGLLIRSRGNLLSRSEDGVWDLGNIAKVHVGEITATSAGKYAGDSDGMNLLLTIQLVFKNDDTLNIGPELRDDKWVQEKVDEINRFLHKWQRQL